MEPCNMQNALLILCMAIASIGFIIWYYFSSSLRLPIRYQIMYDANPPYVYRILRRRTTATLINGVIPLIIIFCTNLICRPSWNDLNISFHWNDQVALYSGIGVAVVLLMSWFSSKSIANLEMYPEIRVRFWRPSILIGSALSWILYIIAYEFFYRGLLLQALLFKLDPIPAIATSTALYSLTHYFKLNRLTFMSIIWSILSSCIVIETGSVLPAVIIHLALCLLVEWFSIKHHQEMYVRRS